MQCIRLFWLGVLALAVALPMRAQSAAAPAVEPGNIVGTVTNVSDHAVSGATVLLQGPTSDDRRAVQTNDNGFYELAQVKPGVRYHIVVSEEGFADWTSPEFELQPGTAKIVDCTLNVAMVQTTVSVTPSTEAIAAAQVHQELQQRVLGFIPNFYVVYDSDNAVPLTAKLKFKLALRVMVDPITITSVAAYAGMEQAGGTPDFPQGAKGYGERFGAAYADNFSDSIIGGAILPTLLHQDPRYFYKGTGTIKSRILYALRTPFVCKGDNGRWQPNYSTMGGDLASSAISLSYYPASNGGAGWVFGNFAISTAEREISAIAQEFILRKFTHNAPRQQ